MITFKEIEKTDFKNIFGWRNHPDVRKMMFNPSEIHWDKHVKYWETLLLREDIIKYKINYEGDDCGVIMLALTNEGKTGEIDIFIDPTFQGKGIGSDSLNEIIKVGKKLGVKKIIGKVIPENIASAKSFEKAGFIKKFVQLEYEI